MNGQITPATANGAAPVRHTPGLAIASLVLGIISLMGAAILIVPMLLAIIFGHVSLARIRKDQNLTGAGIAVTGLVLGYVSIFFGLLMAGMVAALAVPAFARAREESMRHAMANDARQIASAAQQVMLEKGVTTVSFEIDPATGRVSGPIAEYVKQVTPGTRAVDGVLASPDDTFSLQNPRVDHGAVVTFDASGNRQ